MDSFWQKLRRPIMVLAPMADVTDAAYRALIAKYGKPDVLWTEFVSADGLALAPEEGRKKLLKDLEYSESERPIVAQFFTSSPENMKKAASLACKLGFDGVDINMGCPDRGVEKQGAGAHLLKDAAKARALVRATKEGAGEIPVSIKIRAGYNNVNLDEWLPEVLREKPAVVTLHARTRKEMSKVPARWELVQRAVEIRDKVSPKTLVFGNGDILNLEDAEAKVKAAGADGAMLGRAIFGRPWLFNKEGREPTLQKRLEIVVEHSELFKNLLGEYKNFAVMKKHFKAYVRDFPGAMELRLELMETESAEEVKETVTAFIKTL